MNNSDPTAKVTAFLDHVLKSLDQGVQPHLILPQLHQSPRIIVNGEPFGSRDQFQKVWLSLPQTQHQVTSIDTHAIPSANQFILLAHLKVKFNESGFNRMGMSANLHQVPVPTAPNWSKGFGVVLSAVVDASIIDNFNHECISSWDYRFTEKPDSSLYNV